MGRPLRIQYPGALYHITSRGNEKGKIFFDDADRERFLRFLEEYHIRYGILLHSFVLMDNHYHLILETPQGNLLKVMHGLNSGYTGYVNRKYARVGHLFQGRYKSILVEKETYLLELSRYVHLNPIRAGMVKDVSDYRWSSCPGFIRKKDALPWIEYRWILDRFSANVQEARRAYRSFLREGLKEDRNRDPFQNLFGQVVIGSKSFIRKAKQRLEGKRLDQEIVERRRFHAAPTLDAILKEVSSRFGVSRASLLGKNGYGNLPRKAALYLAHQTCNLTNREIALRFGGLHPSAVSQMSTRFEKEMAKEPHLKKTIRDILSIVKA